MKIASFFTILIALNFFISSCKKKDDNVTKVESAYNVSYGPDAKNVFDVYFPTDRNVETTKIMVLIYGGSWQIDNKTHMSGYISRLKQELPDYAFVVLNYRLCTEDPYTNGFPTQEEDIQLALEYIKTLAPQWKVSTNITLFGMNSGAHLALLQAYKHNSDNTIKAVAVCNPPTNLAEGFEDYDLKGVIELLTGGTPTEVPEVYFNSSPINFTNSAVPTILFHGSNDAVVPVQQSVLLNDSLVSNGKTVSLNVFPGEGHAFSSIRDAETIEKMCQFFKVHNP